MYQPNEIKITGGGQIGWTRASWPFVTLTVNRDRLEIKASILGNFVFLPSDIVSIEQASGISMTGGSIRINHHVVGYKSNIVFQCSESAVGLINKINQTGFLTNTDPVPAHMDAEIKEARLSGSFPIKVPAAIAIVVIWNLCMFIDFRHFFDGSDPIQALGGIGTRMALGFMMLVCVSLLTVDPIRLLILKKGRSIEDVKFFLYFILFICTCMMIVTLSIPR